MSQDCADRVGSNAAPFCNIINSPGHVRLPLLHKNLHTKLPQEKVPKEWKILKKSNLKKALDLRALSVRPNPSTLVYKLY